MNEKKFSAIYKVRKLNVDDVNQIYDLCRQNSLYYEYCQPMVSRESIKEDLVALPPNISINQKYFVGFYDSEKLIAVMDVIDGYPEKAIAFVGFFMTDISVQNKGLGSAIISDFVEYLRTEKYESVRLAWVKGNPQSEHFWTKNGFRFLKETSSSAADCVILAERVIEK